MDTSANSANAIAGVETDRRTAQGCHRPKFTIYHPNAKGTGCAISFDLVPAAADADGFIMLSFANQTCVGNRLGATPVYPKFDWEGRLAVKLDFADICRFMQVFRGECESIEDGRGLYHTSVAGATRILLRHMLAPVAGYSLDIYRTPAGGGADRSAHIMLNAWEALGVSVALEDSIGPICFGARRFCAESWRGETYREVHEPAA